MCAEIQWKVLTGEKMRKTYLSATWCIITSVDCFGFEPSPPLCEALPIDYCNTIMLNNWASFQ